MIRKNHPLETRQLIFLTNINQMSKYKLVHITLYGERCKTTENYNHFTALNKINKLFCSVGPNNILAKNKKISNLKELF